MANFPRIKWLNVDGQQVPFTEPQHFTGNGDETVRTGHDNPLPVANYTQNESGLWLPTSKENPMPTQVTGSIREYFKDRDIEVESGDTVELITIVPPEKKYIFGSIRAENEHEFEMDVNWRITHSNSWGWTLTAERILKSDGKRFAIPDDYLKVKSNVAVVRLTNNSNEKQNYISVTVLGVD